MNNRIYRSINEPVREGLSWDEKWRRPDKGLIIAWEVGRELSGRKPELSIRAKNGELPVTAWKGGVEKKINKKEKYGTQKYLAQWQGLRGEDLDIDLDIEQVLTCSKTGMTIVYTDDIEKYRNS